MAQLEGYYFSAALSCTFLVSCLLFSAFSRALREPYMDEIFHLPQAQRYCEGHFSLSQVGSRPLAAGVPVAPASGRSAVTADSDSLPGRWGRLWSHTRRYRNTHVVLPLSPRAG